MATVARVSTDYTKPGIAVSELSDIMFQTDQTTHEVYVRWKYHYSGTGSESARAATAGFDCKWEQATSRTDAGKWKWSTISPDVVRVTYDEAKVGDSGWFRSAAFRCEDLARAVRVTVTPVSNSRSVWVSTTTDKNGNQTKNNATKPYFKATGTRSKVHTFIDDALPKPTITAELGDDGKSLSVTVTSDDIDAHFADVQLSYSGKQNVDITWKVVDDDDDEAPVSTTQTEKDHYEVFNINKKFNDIKMTVGSNPSATVFFDNLARGKKIYLRARVQTTRNEKRASEWQYKTDMGGGEESAVVGETKPKKPMGVYANAVDNTSVEVAWDRADGADTYTVEYVPDNKAYFNTNPSLISRQEGIVATRFTPIDLESGKTYFFRVSAVNDSGESPWSEIVKAKTSSPPEAPTLYPTKQAYMYGEVAVLRWLHNLTDGSEQTSAEVRVNGNLYQTVEGSEMRVELPLLDGFHDGDTVKWRVRTKGAHNEFSPWSEVRQFKVFEEPELDMEVRQITKDGPTVNGSTPFGSYPLFIILDASGGGGKVRAYDVSIIASESVGYLDWFGRTVHVAAGEPVWHMRFDVKYDPCLVRIGPGSLLLSSEGEYRVEASVAMASGLSASAVSDDFRIDFSDYIPAPDCTVTYDPINMTADIVPYCYGRLGNLRNHTLLSVYRFDTAGVLTLLRDNIPNTKDVTITDPHPPFGTCWYQVTAKDTQTGAYSFGSNGDDSTHNSAVIQFGEGDEPVTENGSYTGYTLDGLYNRSFSESGSVKKTLVAYDGREREVSYYGTQLGETLSYSCEFPSNDEEKLALVRKLKATRDDCYIRESTGFGCWVSLDSVKIQVSTDDIHKVRVDIDATPVDRTDGVTTEDDATDVKVKKYTED